MSDASSMITGEETDKMSPVKEIAVSLEHRFYRCQGVVYTRLSFSYEYWLDYLSYFDRIYVIARVEDVPFVSESYREASGDNVEFYDMPYYIGPKQLIRKLPSVLCRARTAALTYDYFLLRSGNITNFMWLFILMYRKRYVREFPGHIKEGIEGVVGKSGVTRLLASLLHALAKIQGRYSKANSFVSEYCAELYGSDRPGFVFSSFQPEEIAQRKESYGVIGEGMKIVSVGRLEGEKGHEDLIKAAAILSSQKGVQIEIHLIGDGRKKERLDKVAKELGVNCIFHGSIVERSFLFKVVGTSDIFVMPSHTEGMPRALLEAMRIGMPCIGTEVGGIPEVLSKEALVLPSSPDLLAEKILYFYSCTDFRKLQGVRNSSFIESRYNRDITELRKHEFWSRVYE